MKKYQLKFILIGICLLSITSFMMVKLIIHPISITSSTTLSLYVSPKGNDSTGDGSKQKPFLSIEAARNKIRTIPKDIYSDIIVYLREGEYFQPQTLQFGLEDSGTPSCTITYCSYPGETAILTGSKTLPTSAFKAVDDPRILERIQDTEAKDKLFEVALSDYGIDEGAIVPTGFGVGNGEEIAPAEVFFDNTPMTLSRWPNKSLVELSGLSKEDSTSETSYINKFNYYLEPRPENWVWNNDLWVRGYFVSSGWGDCTFHIEDINQDTKEITTHEAPIYGYNMTGKYFYYLNILEEIDMPGEYYIDRSTHILYFYPPYDVELGTIKVSQSPNLLISGSELSYVHFKHLIFEGTRNSGISIVNSSTHILIDSCVIRNIGRVGVIFDGVSYCTIQNSEIKYTGKGGLYFYGGDREHLISGHLVSMNNHITNYNRIWKTYNPGIMIAAGMGCQVENTLIHDSSHTAILFNGNDNLLNANELYDITQETDDAGAIYSGRDYTYRGNILSNNFIHDGKSIVTYCGTTGIYLDDAMSSAEVYNNIIINFYQGFVLGGGRDHSIYNNIVLQCDYSLNFDDRNQDLTPAEFKGLETYAPFAQLNLWQTTYPLLYAMLQDTNPGYPKGNSILGNAFYHALPMQLSPHVLTYGKVEGNANISTNIMTEDTAYENFNDTVLKPIYKELPLFQPIDFDSIGINFETITQLDTTFDLKLPKKDSSVILDKAGNVYFAWQGLAYADQYMILISTDPLYKHILVKKLIEDTFCTIDKLEKNHTYYWKVISIQHASSVPAELNCESLDFSFTID